jgi:hypothetical protein
MKITVNPRVLRSKLKMSQSDFWGNVGVTQSGGCRYEINRRIPKPVLMLLELYYGKATIESLKSGKLSKIGDKK